MTQNGTSDSSQVKQSTGFSDTRIEPVFDDDSTGSDADVIGPDFYDALLVTHDGSNSEKIVVQNISYTNNINSADPMTVEVEPQTFLDNETYLGGELTVFLYGSVLFSGEIEEITPNDGLDTYSIYVSSPVRRLNGSDMSESATNQIVSDFLAKTIDKFNDFDDEHFNMAGTADETLDASITEVDNTTRQVDDTTGDCVYADVGTDAAALEVIYAKITTDPDVVIQVDDDGGGSFSETFNSNSEGTHGDWVRVDPQGLNSGQTYDITFTLNSSGGPGSILYDWIALTEDEVSRVVDPFTSGEGSTNVNKQSASTNSEFDTEFSDDKEVTDPVYTESGKLKLAQSCFYGTDSNELNFSGQLNEQSQTSPVQFIANESDTFGIGIRLLDSSDSVSFTFTPDYDIPAEEWAVLIRWGLEEEPAGSFDEVGTMKVKVDGTVIKTLGVESQDNPDIFQTDVLLRWDTETGFGNNDFVLSGGTSHTVEVDMVSDDGSDPYWVDALGIIDERYNYTFDDNPDSNYNADGPEHYPDNFEIKGNEEVSDEAIEEGTLSITMNNTSEDQRIQLSFDSGDSWDPTDGTENNTTSVTVENFLPSTVIQGRIRFSRWDSGAQNATPKFGYNGQELDTWDITVDTESIDLIHNQTVEGDRLQVISRIGDSSNTIWRDEGYTVFIFQRGERLSSPTLRKEKVKSPMSIRGVYSEAKTIGDGIEGNVIQSTSAPQWLKDLGRRKVLRDPEITDIDDADRNSEEFLSRNGAIVYQGEITTLPTMAPVGDRLPGTIFSHNKSIIIHSVRYGINRTTLSCGLQKKFDDSIIDLSRKIQQYERTST